MPTPRGIHRRTQFSITSSLQTRFWRRVERRSDAECWLWLGANRNGYGAIKGDEGLLGTHVVSFVLHNGPIPDGLIVTHTCDNRLCVNPAHLKAGTFADNVRDMDKRRAISRPHGTEITNAVLDDTIVRRIRSLQILRGFGTAKISRELALSHWAVKGVVERKNWRHVEDPTMEEALVIVANLEAT